MKCSPSHPTTTPKKDNISPIKHSRVVYSSSRSSNNSYLCKFYSNATFPKCNSTNATFNACWNTATTRRHWIEQWRPLPKSDRIYQFFRNRFNQRRLQFLIAYSFSIDLESWSVMLLQCWDKFSDDLVQCSNRMICAENCKTYYLWLKYPGLLFSGHGVWMPCKISVLPGYAYSYFSRNC